MVVPDNSTSPCRGGFREPQSETECGEIETETQYPTDLKLGTLQIMIDGLKFGFLQQIMVNLEIFIWKLLTIGIIIQAYSCHIQMCKYEPQPFWFTLCMYIKPGGVPDKLCIFPTDKLETAAVQGSRACPTMTAFFFMNIIL